MCSQLLQQFSASSGGSSESPAEEFLVSVQLGSGGSHCADPERVWCFHPDSPSVSGNG